MRTIGFLFGLLCSAGLVFGQGPTVELRKLLTGVDCLETVGGQVFVSEASAPVVETVGYVDLGAIPEKPDRLLFVVEDVNRVRLPSDAVETIGHGKYVIRGKGRVWLDVSVRDKASGFYMDRLDLPTVTLDLPGAKPGPGPGPGPKPDVIVPNDYGVGSVAIANAPSDPDLARKIAALYRYGAGRLFGNPTLADVPTIVAEINGKFNARQCRDKPTCEQWAKWKVAVDRAFMDEQTRRKTFSRQDWFAAWSECATALEAVK
jgi:hypothetical protein